MDWQAIYAALPSLGEGLAATLQLCVIAALCSLLWGPHGSRPDARPPYPAQAAGAL